MEGTRAAVRAARMAASVIRADSSIIGSNTSIMEQITEETHIIQVGTVVGLEISAVIYGVQILCVNVWEVICVHASKV